MPTTLRPPPFYELGVALSKHDELSSAFDRLSQEQRDCYVDWVAASDNAAERRNRSEMVAKVVRVLSGLAA